MYFSKIAKVVLLTTVITMSSNASMKAKGAGEFDWGPLMDAITQVESNGNSRAVSGKSCGAMQITPILVKDCNDILKRRGHNKRYTLDDRFSVKKSREMFVLIMSHYNPENSIERAIRIWNGGAHFTVRSTQRYYEKVMRLFKG
jgi:hypothetical protein